MNEKPESPRTAAEAINAFQPAPPTSSLEKAIRPTMSQRAYEPKSGEFHAFSSIEAFENAQRMAMALCTSTIVPETYRGKENIGNALIALEISNRIGANVLAVMQNLYIVYGRPAWSSQFLISCVNASGKFTPLRYRMTGEKGTDTWGCIAWAKDGEGEVLESPEVTFGMARAEGWVTKNGSKWKTMPELMLRYRAATLFARLYAPELTMGIRTDEEVIDIETIPVAQTSPVVTEPTKPAFEPEPTRMLAGVGVATAPSVLKETPKAPEAAKSTDPAFTPRQGSSDAVNNILFLAQRDSVAEDKVFEFLKTIPGMVRGETKLDEFSTNGRDAKLVQFAKTWETSVIAMKQEPGKPSA